MDPQIVIDIDSERDLAKIIVADQAIYEGQIDSKLSKIISQYISMGYELKIKET